MPTNISARNFELTPAIHAYIEAKTATLAKYNEAITDIDVEVDKNMHHKKGEVFHVRWNVPVPHDLVHVEATELDLYAAIDVCRDEAVRQLEKYKDKFAAKRRDARNTRRSLKSILWFWKRSDED